MYTTFGNFKRIIHGTRIILKVKVVKDDKNMKTSKMYFYGI